MFNAINLAINEASFRIDYELYYLLNLIRYGPKDPNILQSDKEMQIKNNSKAFEMVLICWSIAPLIKWIFFVQLLPETRNNH